MYGYRNFIANHFRKTRLATGCHSLSLWVCALVALSPALVLADWGFPWVDHAGLTILKTGRPQRYYTEQEILDAWQPYLPSAMPQPASVSDVFVWLENNGYYNQITPPQVCAITNTERLVDYGEFYVDATNRLVAVAVAPSIGNNHSETDEHVHLFPAYYSSRYGLGFVGLDALDPVGSSPAFGGDLGSGHAEDFGFFTTNLFTTYPWKFTDYESGAPIVYPTQDMTGQESFRRSRAYFKGRLRVMNVYYLFPEAPTMGRVELYRGFPVTRLAAYSMLDEFWLPWYWQTVSGVAWWRDGDTMKLHNVLRFHSSSTNQPGDI